MRLQILTRATCSDCDGIGLMNIHVADLCCQNCKGSGFVEEWLPLADALKMAVDK